MTHYSYIVSMNISYTVFQVGNYMWVANKQIISRPSSNSNSCEWNYIQSQYWQHGQTDRQTRATTIPECQIWPRANKHRKPMRASYGLYCISRLVWQTRLVKGGTSNIPQISRDVIIVCVFDSPFWYKQTSPLMFNFCSTYLVRCQPPFI